MPKITKDTLKINGMHCSSCAMLIDGDLEDLDGVISAKTNYHKQETEVEYDEEKLKTEQLISSVKESGYEAKKGKL
ncbi:MAG: cation transporter [bacterium]|nr:cation transporter [bacterium]